MKIVAGTYHVELADRTVECSLRGRVKQKDARFVSVGDLVRVQELDNGSCRIDELLPWHSALTRHGVARRREQVIVANVDQVAVVVSVTRPDPDFSMIDRLLALSELSELDGLLIVNKVDLWERDESEADSPPSEFEPYVDAGYDVLLTSAETGSGLDRLRELLSGRVTVLSGPSGVGKSSLLNALMPGLDLRVGEVGEKKGRGRHTTVAASLYPFAGGGHVADTPGLQYLALWEVEPTELTHAFREFTPVAAGCRFADCRHRAEPGCAVRDAVQAGGLSTRRYQHYMALLQEAEEGR